MRLPVLIVLHQENSTPGRVGNALRERGYALDIRKPRFGDLGPIGGRRLMPRTANNCNRHTFAS